MRKLICKLFGHNLKLDVEGVAGFLPALVKCKRCPFFKFQRDYWESKRWKWFYRLSVAMVHWFYRGHHFREVGWWDGIGATACICSEVREYKRRY